MTYITLLDGTVYQTNLGITFTLNSVGEFKGTLLCIFIIADKPLGEGVKCVLASDLKRIDTY